MMLFSKPKSTDKDSEIFLSEFPVWTAIHSVRLVDELQKEANTGWASILKHDDTRSKLIDCLIGAHVFYLISSAEGEIVATLFGENILQRSLTSLPQKSKVFFALTQAYFEKKHLNGKDEWLLSLEDFYKIKIDPLDACIAFVTEQEVCPSMEFAGLTGDLLPILNRLQVEQLVWMGELVDKWSGQGTLSGIV